MTKLYKLFCKSRQIQLLGTLDGGQSFRYFVSNIIFAENEQVLFQMEEKFKKWERKLDRGIWRQSLGATTRK